MIRDFVAVTVERLADYKLRAALAAAGMCIASATMVLLANLVGSAFLAATHGFTRLGSQLLFITTAVPSTLPGVRPPVPLNLTDLQALRLKLTTAEAVIPLLTITTQVRACGTVVTVPVVGAMPEQQVLAQLSLAQGRFITDLDIRRSAAVAVVGAGLGTKFRCLRGPGYFVVIGDRPYEIVGTLAAEGRDGGTTSASDDAVLIPFSLAERTYGQALRRPLSILIMLRQGVDIGVVRQDVEGLLRQRHGIRPPTADDFTVRTELQIVEAAGRVGTSVTYVVVFLMSWSLLIATVGVLNSVYTSVVERTDEIGLRRAVGASRKHILGQFVLEGLIVSSVGAFVGACLGTLLSRIVASLFGLPPFVNWDVIRLAMLASFILGLAASLWPAHKAAVMEPIDALRHE